LSYVWRASKSWGRPKRKTTSCSKPVTQIQEGGEHLKNATFSDFPYIIMNLLRVFLGGGEEYIKI